MIFYRSHQSFPKATRATRLVMESLENRTLLSCDGFVSGDANLDGVFNSMDLVQVLQAGKYETSQAAEWSDGDWNCDGRFDSQDVIAAFQRGTYSLGTAAAAIELPFKGSLEGSYTFVPDPEPSPFASVHLVATGVATPLGRFTLDAPHRVNLAILVGTGTFELTAANGDKVIADFTGQATPTETEGVVSIVETATITGGTGRFAGATGSFTVERMVDLASPLATGSFDGSIVIPKA